jgi:hypothetical protein
MIFCTCITGWQLYELKASNPFNGLAVCYPAMRNASIRYTQSEQNKINPFDLACYLVLYDFSINGRNSKDVANLVYKMGVKEILTQLSNPNVISLGNNRASLPKKPTGALLNEAKQVCLDRGKEICPNLANHEGGAALQCVCIHCGNSGYVYRTYQGELLARNIVDASHNDRGAWAKNLDVEAYLNPDNMFIERASENRKRAKEEARYLHLRLTNMGSNLSEKDVFLYLGIQDILSSC